MRICPECMSRYDDSVSNCGNDGTKLLSLSADEDPRIGTVVADRYLILGILGEGGMGVVYRAYQLAMARQVALKTLHTSGPARDALIKRFAREARATAALKSPHTVTVFDFGSLDEGASFYLVMEHLDGKPLNEVVEQDGPLALARVRTLGMQVCQSLSEAHKANMVHRDMKPSNIMLGESSTGGDFATVLDFGIVKVLDEETTELTATGTAVGSIAYMSPEQIDGREVGPGADLYSLGCTLFDVATNELPFDAPTKLALMFKHLSAQPPRLMDRLGDTEDVRKMDAILHKCLAKVPEERYPSADELYRAFEALQLSPAANEPPPKRAEESPASPASLQPQTAPTPDAGRKTVTSTTAGPAAALATTQGEGQPLANVSTGAPTASADAWEPAAPRRRVPLWVIPATLAAGIGAFLLIDAAGGDGTLTEPPGADATHVAALVSDAAPTTPTEIPDTVQAPESETADGPAATSRPEDAASGAEAHVASPPDASAAPSDDPDSVPSVAIAQRDAGARQDTKKVAGPDGTKVAGKRDTRRTAPVAKQPRVTARVHQDLPQAAGRAAARKAYSKLRSCHKRFGQGPVKVIIQVKKDGRVSHVGASPDGGMKDCVQATLKAITFPALTQGSLATVTYTITP